MTVEALLESDTRKLQHLSPEDDKDEDTIDDDDNDQYLDIFNEENPLIFRVVFRRKPLIRCESLFPSS